MAPTLAMYCANGLADLDGSDAEEDKEEEEDDADDSCCRTLPTVCTLVVTAWDGACVSGYQKECPQ